MNLKKTLVLGASPNPERASWQVVKKLNSLGFETIAVGNKSGSIGQIDIKLDKPFENDIHTISMYLNADRQKEFYSYILSVHPRRIIFNPGAENSELAVLAAAHGIQVENACTLVLLSTGQF